jgi:hypothetical protein
MGNYRYYLAPEGVLTLEDLPEKWGLIEVTPRGHLKVRAGHVLLAYRDLDVWRHESNQVAELSTLALCLNRVGDPQAVQERLREQMNLVSRLQRRNEELAAKNAELARRLRECQLELDH